jgi:FkbM family methyltransferase
MSLPIDVSYIFDPWKRAYILWVIRYLLTPRFKEVLVTLPDGTIMKTADFASFFSTYKSVFVDRIYDFRSPIDNPYIVICGENIGLSVLFFKQLYPKSRVTAFEADRYIYSILKENVKNAHLTDVDLQNVAVWNKNTALEFTSDHADGGRIERAKKSRKNKVKAIDFREFLRKHPDITFLNMDIEGAEDTVLDKALPLMTAIPYIFIEYHSFLGRKQSLGSIVKFLEDSGYRIHVRPEFFSQAPFTKIRVRDDMDMQVNIFAWKDTGILSKPL